MPPPVKIAGAMAMLLVASALLIVSLIKGKRALVRSTRSLSVHH
jgi:hypothetical protein